MSGHPIAVFGLDESAALATSICTELGLAPGALEERDFEDGEHKARARENVRGRDVYLVQSLYSDDRYSVNDKLCRALFLIGALRDAGAARVTAVLPYLCYARKDRKTKSRDPVTMRYVAQLFEAVGIDCVLTLDVHNLAAYQNAFRAPAEHLQARALFAPWFAARLADEPVVVMSPDAGGIKRAERLREALADALGREVDNAFMEKQRSAGVVTGSKVVGDLEGRTVIVVDDLISTGGTIQRAAAACREHGAARIFAAAAHGLFVGDASAVLADAGLEQLVITDSIEPFRLDRALRERLVTVLPTAPLFAAAIGNLHDGSALAALDEP